jgi:hypothetical protein
MSASHLALLNGAGDRDRTGMTSLEALGSTGRPWGVSLRWCAGTGLDVPRATWLNGPSADRFDEEVICATRLT